MHDLMKSTVKLLRRRILVNILIRNILRFLGGLSLFTREQLLPRWSISGTLQLRFRDHLFKYFSNCDDVIADRIYYGIGFERQELELFLTIARQSQVIIDVGANTGIYTILAALTNRGANLHSFEPHPRNFARLVRNLELNSLRNVHAIQKGLGDHTGAVTLTIPQDESVSDVASVEGEFTRSFYSRPCKNISVELITLDDYLSQNNITRLDLLKIDAEYYETKVLNGGRKALEQFSPVVLCEVIMFEVLNELKDEVGSLSRTHASEIQTFFEKLGYYSYSLGQSGLLRVENILSNPDSRNYLFSKRKSEKRFIPYADEAALLHLRS